MPSGLHFGFGLDLGFCFAASFVPAFAALIQIQICRPAGFRPTTPPVTKGLTALNPLSWRAAARMLNFTKIRQRPSVILHGQ
jgi:hypothetical protein